tara:strand:- start:1249 stop:1530 length:282 start_codon:yes stop_codon:yes gene_type:complete
MDKNHKIALVVLVLAVAVVALQDNNVINITGQVSHDICEEGPLDEYRCYPLVVENPFMVQRLYQYQHCSKRWFKLEDCSTKGGCNRETKQCNG